MITAKGKFTSIKIHPGNGYCIELKIDEANSIYCTYEKLDKVKDLIGKQVKVSYLVPSVEIYGINLNTLVSIEEIK
jgi:hypothetical protein